METKPNLEDNVKKQIKMDLSCCNEKIVKILETRDTSFVADPDYLHPSFLPRVMDLENVGGLFYYFTQIRIHLKKGLRNGYFEKEFLNFRPPQIYKNLILNQGGN